MAISVLLLKMFSFDRINSTYEVRGSHSDLQHQLPMPSVLILTLIRCCVCILANISL